MALVERKASLIIESIIKENPGLPYTLTTSNCWVYHFRYEDGENGWCYIRGRFNSGLGGKRLVKYTKLDFATLLLGCNLLFSRVAGNSNANYLGMINLRFGLDLTQDDIILEPIAVDATQFTVTIKPTHTLYRGSVTFGLGNEVSALKDLITDRSVSVTLDTYNNSELLVGNLLTANVDYSAIATTLSAYITPTRITEANVIPLVNALKSIDEVDWGIVTNTIYSLVDGTIIYNGLTTEVTDSSYSEFIDTTYSNVFVIKPISNSHTKLSDMPIVFHYNMYNIRS